MRIVIALICGVMLAGCGRPPSSPPPPTPVGMIRVPDGQLVFAPPEGWSPMAETAWRGRGFSAGFQKGNDPKVPSSYFLVTVRRQKKWPETALQGLIDKAAVLADAQDLAGYVSSGKHKSRPELYSAKHKMFFFVQDYPDGTKQSTTVMAKRFCDQHYVVFHFYLRDSLEADVGVVSSVLASLAFDEDQKKPTTP